MKDEQRKKFDWAGLLWTVVKAVITFVAGGTLMN